MTTPRAWRESKRLTREGLARLVGFGPSSIYQFETHPNSSREGYTRYRLCCAALEAGLLLWDFSGAALGIDVLKEDPILPGDDGEVG